MATVLIVDDDRFTRSVLEKILAGDPALRQIGLEVVAAGNGDEALALFRARRPDFVVVDLQLPGQDGMELCARLRAEPGGDLVALAVIGSAYRAPHVAGKLEKELGARFFSKPYQLRGLTEYLSATLTAASGRRATPSRAPLPRPRMQSSASGVTSGDLGDRPLPAVLLDLWEAEASGRLSLRRGQVAKEVDLVMGHPRSVVSNVRDETLGYFLLARGVIDRAQHDRAMQRAAAQREKVGAALIALGVLSAEELIAQLTAQARFKLMRALRWNDGSWSFQPREQPATGFHGEAVEMTAVVLRGLARTASIEPLPPRVADLRGQPVSLNRRGMALIPVVRRVFGTQVVDRWSDGATPEGLIERGIDRVGLFTVLEALLLCDAIAAPGAGTAVGADGGMAAGTGRGEAGRGGGGRGMAVGTITAEPSDALSVADLSDHTRALEARAGTRAGDSSPSSLYASLFGDETTAVGPEAPTGSTRRAAVMEAAAAASVAKAVASVADAMASVADAALGAGAGQPQTGGRAAVPVGQGAAAGQPRGTAAAAGASPVATPGAGAAPADSVHGAASLTRQASPPATGDLREGDRGPGPRGAAGAAHGPAGAAPDPHAPGRGPERDTTPTPPPTPLRHEDSGVIAVENLRANDDLFRAREQLLDEYLRIQGANHYEILQVARDAPAPAIAAAVVERLARFSADFFGRFDLGRDYAKLEEIQEAYERARSVLLDPAQRAEHDGELAARDRAARAPTLEAEIRFRAAEDLLSVGQYAGAIEKLEAAVASAPSEASYHAALGWARFLAGGRDASAADAALPHLNQALAINPDYPAAHEYKGIIAAALGNDDTLAVQHLERALDADPTRDSALEAIEGVWRRSGELRPLERQYRRLLYRLAGRARERELALWLKLAALYRNELDDADSARVAYASAARLAPDDAAIQASLADIESGTLDRFHERAQELRARWRQDRTSHQPAVELYEHALGSGRYDAAFCAASALVAVSAAPPSAQEMYQRYRPRFVIRAQRRFEPELWDEVRHPSDSAAIGNLFAMLEPVVSQAMPLGLADLEVDEGTRVGDDELPAAFVRQRAYVAHMLGVAEPAAYSRPDFGRQIHVAAVSPPVLLVGDEALAAPERAELAFRLGRAMTYLRPGRTMAGSHPARFLKQVLLAAFSAVHPGGPDPDDPDGTIAQLGQAFAALPADTLSEARRLLDYIQTESRAINLSEWARAMARTADRVGLVLCGDLPAAARFSRDVGGAEAQAALLDFAVSPPFGKLRAHMGLSIDV